MVTGTRESLRKVNLSLQLPGAESFQIVELHAETIAKGQLMAGCGLQRRHGNRLKAEDDGCDGGEGEEKVVKDSEHEVGHQDHFPPRGERVRWSPYPLLLLTLGAPVVMRKELLMAVPVGPPAKTQNAVDNEQQEVHGANGERQEEQREVGLPLILAAGHGVGAGGFRGEHDTAQVAAASGRAFGAALGQLSVGEGGEEDVASAYAVLEREIEVCVTASANRGKQEGKVKAEF